MAQRTNRGNSQGSRIAVAVIEDNDLFVVGPRPEGVHLAGYWEFPGGKIAGGESPAEAARREAWEETGLVVEVTGPLTRVDYRDDERELELHFLACRVESPSPPRAPFHWVTRSQLAGLRFPPANAQLMQLLQTRKFSRKR